MAKEIGEEVELERLDALVHLHRFGSVGGIGCRGGADGGEHGGGGGCHGGRRLIEHGVANRA